MLCSNKIKHVETIQAMSEQSAPARVQRWGRSKFDQNCAVGILCLQKAFSVDLPSEGRNCIKPACDANASVRSGPHTSSAPSAPQILAAVADILVDVLSFVSFLFRPSKVTSPRPPVSSLEKGTCNEG